MKYRKRPVVIEAHQWDGYAAHALELCAWIGDAASYAAGHIYIKTLEGTMAADPLDFIIRGVQGEHYPCKPDIFDASYEIADPGANV